jgi:CRISPR-associated protein Cse2 (CRISPR_cse2).
MDDKKFFEGLMALREDKGKMAGLRRIFNPDSSRIQGLKIISSIGVTDLNNDLSLPYKIVAFLFGSLKAESLGSGPNLGTTLQKGVRSHQEADEKGNHPFDRRFDALVASTSIKILMHHITKILTYLEGELINFYLLLKDLKNWGPQTANMWIEGYYI